MTLVTGFFLFDIHIIKLAWADTHLKPRFH